MRVLFVINGVPQLIPLITGNEQLHRTSQGATLAGACGGFRVEVMPPHVVARLVVMDVADRQRARVSILSTRERLIERCNQLGGRDSSPGGCVRELDCRHGRHGYLDVRAIVTGVGLSCEGFARRAGNLIAERVANITGGRVAMRVEPGSGESKLVRATAHARAEDVCSARGTKLAGMIAGLSRLGAQDEQHATDLNYQLLAGVAAALRAKGEKVGPFVRAALAYAQREQQTYPLAHWQYSSSGILRGSVVLPIAVSGFLDELSAVLGAVALASSLGSLRALAARLAGDELTFEKQPEV
jgi:hydroxymethylglutaryl-CoA reductase